MSSRPRIFVVSCMMRCVQVFGILVAYGFIVIGMYVPFVTSTPYLFRSLFPQKVVRSNTIWGSGSKLS